MSNQIEVQDAELEDLMAMLAAESVAIVKTLEGQVPAPEPVVEESLPVAAVQALEKNGTSLPEEVTKGKSLPWEDGAPSAAVQTETSVTRVVQEEQVDPELAILADEQAADLAQPPVDHFANVEAPPAADDLSARLKAALGGGSKNVTQVAKTEEAVERRVVMNDEGEVLQSAMSFEKAKVVPFPVQEEVTDVPMNDCDYDMIVGKSRSGLDYYVEFRDFNTQTRISPTDLDSSFLTHHGMAAYYSDLASKAASQHNRQKALFEQIEAKLYSKHRSSIAASGEKATEKAIEMAVRQDPLYTKAEGKVIEAQEIADSNKGFAMALNHRRDMLNMLGHDRRNEQKGALRVLEEQQGRDDLFSRASSVGRRAVSNG